MKYLIIDDNENIRQIIRQTIIQWESDGIVTWDSANEYDNIEECSDGDDALSAYTSFQPDFVLMDIQMKKMDGLLATVKLREKFPNARVIIITDNDTPSYRAAAVKAGALAFISKENLSALKEYLNL